jgi:hypothetical protein
VSAPMLARGKRSPRPISQNAIPPTAKRPTA